jgi:tRNA threonylcarbamoyladenosine biosynthesis protein TsaB
MKILAADTALGACSVAILEGERIIAHRWAAMIRGHAEALAPMVQEVLDEAGATLAGIDRLAVTTGPGTFTGQRVGLAFMRGLRLALDRPLVGITTLAAMAAAVEQKSGLIAVVHDARRGEAYGALYDRMKPVIPVCIAEFARLMEDIQRAAGDAHDLVLAGTGAESAAQWFRGRGRVATVSAIRQPDARYVAHLASTYPEPGATARPLYLRAPDAKLARDTIRLRPATVSDKDLLAELNTANLPEEWDAEFFAGVLESPGGFGFIAEAHGAPTGFVLARAVASEAEILAIGVSTPYRRNGIARRLLQAAGAGAGDRGAEALFLEVADDNEAAGKLYESQGFRLAGRRRRYYSDGRDALLLRASIPLELSGLGVWPKVE